MSDDQAARAEVPAEQRGERPGPGDEEVGLAVGYLRRRRGSRPRPRRRAAFASAGVERSAACALGGRDAEFGATAPETLRWLRTSGADVRCDAHADD